MTFRERADEAVRKELPGPSMAGEQALVRIRALEDALDQAGVVKLNLDWRPEPGELMRQTHCPFCARPYTMAAGSGGPWEWKEGDSSGSLVEADFKPVQWVPGAGFAEKGTAR